MPDELPTPSLDQASLAPSEPVAPSPDQTARDGDPAAGNVVVTRGGIRQALADEVAVTVGGIGTARADTIRIELGGIGAARADRIRVELGAIGFAAAREVRIRGGAVQAMAAQAVTVDRAVVQAVFAQRVTFRRRALVGMVVAARVDGDVRPVLDWRGGLAVGAVFGLCWAILRRRR